MAMYDPNSFEPYRMILVIESDHSYVSSLTLAILAKLWLPSKPSCSLFHRLVVTNLGRVSFLRK